MSEKSTGTVAIRILNFQKFKGRSDVKNNSWFRCSNRLLEDPDFFDFTHEEICVWLYFLSLSSQKNCDVIHVSHQHAWRVCRLSSDAITSTIEKLSKINVIEKIRTRTARGRYAPDTFTCSTGQDKTDRTEQTGQDKTWDEVGHVDHSDQNENKKPDAHQLVDFWNEQQWTLEPVRELTFEHREQIETRLGEAPLSDWKEAIKAIHQYDFLLGKNEGSTWKADFDWFISDPDSRLKIISGKYKSKLKGKSKQEELEILKAKAVEKARTEAERAKKEAERDKKAGEGRNPENLKKLLDDKNSVADLLPQKAAWQ